MVLDSLTPLLIIIIGLVLIITGLIILASKHEGKGIEKEYGAVIVIGPIPIIVGSSKKAAIIAGVIAILLLLIVLLFLIF